MEGLGASLGSQTFGDNNSDILSAPTRGTDKQTSEVFPLDERAEIFLT